MYNTYDSLGKPKNAKCAMDSSEWEIREWWVWQNTCFIAIKDQIRYDNQD